MHSHHMNTRTPDPFKCLEGNTATDLKLTKSLYATMRLAVDGHVVYQATIERVIRQNG
jgi:hypothetical protein